jgi:predicted AAA+ superfamily ATPase
MQPGPGCFLNHAAKNDKLKHIDSYKEFQPITKIITANKFNNQYVSNIYSYDDFKNNNTAIIQSCTGTGKTTMVAKHLSKYIKIY